MHPSDRVTPGLLAVLSAVVIAGVLLLFSARPLSAQTSNATLQGRIVDTGSGVMPGVTVKARSARDRSIEVRWEIFNLFNRQNLANPNVNISSGPSFGRITGPANAEFGTGSARQMQFMLRVNF